MISTIKQNIRYFARFDYDPESKETPKYVLTSAFGSYPPMEEIRGKNGKITLRLIQKRKWQPNHPELELQFKSNYNFTGLKSAFVGGKLSGFAYGNPYNGKFYMRNVKKSKKGTTEETKYIPNPFYEYRQDGYLFILHQDEKANEEQGQNLPSSIELIVLAGAKNMIQAYCKSLMIGGFDEDLKVLRAQAEQV